MPKKYTHFVLPSSAASSTQPSYTLASTPKITHYLLAPQSQSSQDPVISYFWLGFTALDAKERGKSLCVVFTGFFC
jgi:hypothetical protein